MSKESVWQPYKTDKSERLLQITSALLYSEHGLTRRELFYAITDYRDHIAANGPDESLNRKFERDKSSLRESGILLHIANPNDPSDEQRYVIASDTFVWPSETSLTSHQLQLLNLAAGAWSMASISAEVNQGLIKLRALGLEPSEADLSGLAPRFKTHEPSFIPLTKAIDEHLAVEFDYRKEDGSVSTRQVEPWQIQNVHGQWLLLCLDTQAGEPRNFLLKRIVSKVQYLRDGEEFLTFEAPASAQLEEAIADLRTFTASQIAELKIRKDSSAWFHFHLDGTGSDRVRFEFMDLHLLAEELSQFALEIEVISPTALRDAIRAGFEKVAADHA